MEGKGITLPAIALRGLTILPEMIQHFDISREKSVGALESAMVGEQKGFLVTQRRKRIRGFLVCIRSEPSPGSSSW